MESPDEKAAQGDARAALRRLRLALALFGAGALVGGPWDMLWHLEHAFESFFSPPHVFIYGLSAASMALVATIIMDRRLRTAFGRAGSEPEVARALPPALLFLAGGLLVVLTSGLLDELWHGAFGVDETRLSAPHAMFGWGLFVAVLGFASARLALAARAPVGRAEGVLFAVMGLSFSLYAFLLPFLVYSTDTTLAAISGMPVIDSQPGAAHTFRIYEAWHVERANVVFVPLAAAWGGVATVLAGLFDGRKSTAVASVALATAVYVVLWYGFAVRLGLQGDPRTWLPLPALPALLVLVLGARREWPASRTAWLAGALFAGLTALAWPPSVGALSPLAAAAVFVAGVAAFKGAGWLAASLGGVVARPEGRAVQGVVVVLGFLVPLALGLLDLGMRAGTA